MPIRLITMPFLQRWDGANLDLRVLVVPRGSPLDALTAGQPAFADASFGFDVRLTTSLDALPTPTGASVTLALAAPPRPQARALFTALAGQFPIDPAPPTPVGRRAGTFIKKHAPESYRAAAQFDGSRTPFVVADDSYACALNRPRTYRTLPPANPKLPWGKVIAIALRQPLLAEALGLIVPLRVTLDPADLLAAGGFVHVVPTGVSFAGEPDGLVTYASRVPALAAARPLFTPVLFPVAAVPPPVSYDELTQEALSYDDGFAKIVHGAQPRYLQPTAEVDDGTRPQHDAGIRLGWDDEQVAIWLNRQIDPASAVADAPMGTAGYRVDARRPGDVGWQSLCRATSSVGVGALAVGAFDGELAIQTHPIQLDAGTAGDYWLPQYFAAWTGPSLVGRDVTAHDLVGATRGKPDLVQGVAPELRLRYGQLYEFRVRLVDQTSGGPTVDDKSSAGPAPVARLRFRRWIRPRRLAVDDVADDAPVSVTVRRPRLPYPEYAFASDAADPVADLRAEIPVANAARREVALPDPDVTAVQIAVQVQSLAFDPIGGGDGFQTLYTTTRAFPADPGAPLALALDWVDVSSVAAFTGPDTGAIRVPTARQIRLQIQALCHDDAAGEYFGADDVRFGPPASIALRRDSSDERGLFTPVVPADALKAIFLQPDLAPDANVALAQRTIGGGVQAPTDAPTRLAAELRLVVDGLTLRARAGQRVLFGAASGLRCTIGPDRASITFASKAELVQHWIVVLRATLARDWTWDGLAADGLAIERDGVRVGTVGLARAASADALVDPDREHTDVVFFDVIDPKPAMGAFPAELRPHYRVTARLASPAALADPPDERDVDLPITTAPAQRPRIVSAGLAMAPYVRSADYARTEPRDRALWIELDRAPDNPDDGYFLRLLRYAPDPILVGPSHDLPEASEPPLPVDPEVIRTIVPGQSDDRAGLDAMIPLVPSASPVHYLVPLPPGVHDDAAELFGFFTYELRVGHRNGWSTAQGRFGAALRVSGAQHPAPPLQFSVERDADGIIVTAPYAEPVLDGRSLQPSPPRTDLWFLLYAQVEQADGQDRRNVLLGRRRGQWAKRRQARTAGLFGAAAWADAEVREALRQLAFPASSPLSCIAVEMLPNGSPVADGLGADLGEQRILRASPLLPIPYIC